MSRQHGDFYISECWMGLEEWVGAFQVNRIGGGDEGSDRGNMNGMWCSAGCGEKELRLAVSITTNTKQVRITDQPLETGAEEWPASSSCTQRTLSAYISFPFLFSSDFPTLPPLFLQKLGDSSESNLSFSCYIRLYIFEISGCVFFTVVPIVFRMSHVE